MVDDEQFEQYLKQFRPLAPQQLPAKRHTPYWRALPVPLWAALAVTVMTVALIRLDVRSNHADVGEKPISTNVAELSRVRPLTVGSANALLARSPSVKAALDQLWLHSQADKLPKNTRSALDVLGEEKTKL